LAAREHSDRRLQCEAGRGDNSQDMVCRMVSEHDRSVFQSALGGRGERGQQMDPACGLLHGMHRSAVWSD
jgi:hypothetical protein